MKLLYLYIVYHVIYLLCIILSMHKRKYVKIYKHRWHVAITLFVVALPFLFLWLAVPNVEFSRQSFVLDLLFSTVRLVIAFVISVVLALVLGLLFSKGKLANVSLPFFDVMQSFPAFALLPLAVYKFGKSDLTVIFFLVFTIIWPVLFAIISSLKLSKHEWEEAALIYGATGWKRIVYFALPVTYPGIITGSIVGLGEGWEAVVGAEIIVGLSDRGLGTFFSVHGETGNIALFGVFALLLFIFALNKIIWLPLLEKSHKLLSE